MPGAALFRSLRGKSNRALSVTLLRVALQTPRALGVWMTSEPDKRNRAQRSLFRDALGASHLHRTTRQVLAVLVNHGMRSWPSEARIAKAAGLSRRTVIRHLAAAEQAGWVTVERRIGDDGRQRTNVYQLKIPAAHHKQDVAPAKGADDGQDLPADRVTGCHSVRVTGCHGEGDRNDQNRVTGCHGGRCQVGTHNPTLEPDTESDTEPGARERARDASQNGSGSNARTRAKGAGSAGGFQGEIVADDVLLELAAAYVESEGAQEVGRAFNLWAKFMQQKGKPVRSRDGAFCSFFRTWTRKRGGFGPEGVTLSRDVIARARAEQRRPHPAGGSPEYLNRERAS